MDIKTDDKVKKIAKTLVADYSACPAKNHVLEMCEEGILPWETVARECIAEMSEDDVADMCRLCEWEQEEEDEEEVLNAAFEKLVARYPQIDYDESTYNKGWRIICSYRPEDEGGVDFDIEYSDGEFTVEGEDNYFHDILIDDTYYNEESLINGFGSYFSKIDENIEKAAEDSKEDEEDEED